MPEERSLAQTALETALQAASREVPQCIASAYIDMTTSTLVALRSNDPLPAPIINLLAAVTGDLFQGRNVSAIERLFRESRHQPEDGSHYFQEIVIFSSKRLHVFLRSRRQPNHVVVFVCRSADNLGMILAKARMSMQELEQIL